MTGRERVDAAFSLEGARQIPAMICYQGIVARDHWAEFTSAPWWHLLDNDPACQLAWRREVAERLGVDMFELTMLPPRRARERLRLSGDGDEVFQTDLLTGERKRLEKPCIGGWSFDACVQSVHTGKLPETWDEIEDLIPSASDRNPEMEIREGAADLAKLTLADFGATLCPMGYVCSPLWHVFDALGFEAMMELTAIRPALIRHAAERILEHALAEIRVQTIAGARVFWLEECMTDMISPEAFRVLNLPLLQRMVAAIHEGGCRSIYYFCGNPAGKWDLIEAVGADALAFEESKKNFSIDIEDVIERAAGRYVVLGNLDSIGVLQNGTEAALEAEVRRQIAAGRRNKGRFIMSLGSPATPGTPVSRIRRFADFVRVHGG